MSTVLMRVGDNPETEGCPLSCNPETNFPMVEAPLISTFSRVLTRFLDIGHAPEVGVPVIPAAVSNLESDCH